MMTSSELRAGDRVRVRSKEAILRSLDKRGDLNGLPFMPEMLEFCGKEFRVFKRAHKTCDPPNGLTGRKMSGAVHLEGVRCSGVDHGGCQARCLIFWKDEWLERIPEGATGGRQCLATDAPSVNAELRCTEEGVIAGARDILAEESAGEPVFICQSTRLSQATQPLRWWDLRQYLEDYTSGNVKVSQLITAVWHCLYERVALAGLGVGTAMRWLYDTVQRMRGGTPYPWRAGKLPKGARTPSVKLDLKPGEFVKVRSYEEILATLDESGRNRGMWFDPEMVPYCGKVFRVLARVDRIVNEKTGKMQRLANDCIMLENVVCLACYAKYRRFCPRNIYPYWREIWLERVAAAREEADASHCEPAELHDTGLSRPFHETMGRR